MSKLKLTQAEIDKLVSVERIDALPTVCGVGFNDVQFQVKVDGKIVWQYHLWGHMLGRCFDAKFKQRSPTYEAATCCDDWLSFATFVEWLNKEVGYSGKLDGYQLDKDLIIKGNKTYSPDVCSLVPQAVNSLLTDHGAARGEFPVGVTFDKGRGKFRACLNCFGRHKHLGYYTTIESASFAYKIDKEAHIKVVALQHKGVLKPAVFESLMNWGIQP